MQSHIPVFVDHVALWVPMLVLTISEYLHELFQNRRLTAVTSLCKLGGIVVVAIDAALMLVVAILCAEHCRTHGAGEVLDVILSVECSDV